MPSPEALYTGMCRGIQHVFSCSVVERILGNNVAAMYQPLERVIYVSEYLAYERKFHALAHEMCHVMLDDPFHPRNRAEEDMIAEIVAHRTLQKAGLYIEDGTSKLLSTYVTTFLFETKKISAGWQPVEALAQQVTAAQRYLLAVADGQPAAAPMNFDLDTLRIIRVLSQLAYAILRLYAMRETK